MSLRIALMILVMAILAANKAQVPLEFQIKRLEIILDIMMMMMMMVVVLVVLVVMIVTVIIRKSLRSIQKGSLMGIRPRRMVLFMRVR